jgi:calpain-15
VFERLFQPAHDDGPAKRFENIQWIRASEIFDDPQIFVDGVNPNDIKQGMLGDCYYLACLSSMAEVHEHVENRFVTKTVNSAGIYMVSLYVNGLKTPVIVDDWIPCIDGKPCFARSNDGELWVCLMEKAWAKLYGTYKRMEAGDPAFAAIHLNGSPAKTHWNRDYKNGAKREEYW